MGVLSENSVYNNNMIPTVLYKKKAPNDQIRLLIFFSGHAKDALRQQHYESPAGCQRCPQTESGVSDLQKVETIHKH